MTLIVKKIGWWVFAALALLMIVFQLFRPRHEPYLPYDAQERESHQ